MKIVVCGAGGMLAADVIEVLQQRGHEVIGFGRRELDITRLGDVTGKLSGLRPDLLVNAAAYTHVDGCESEPERAYQVNALGPRNLAITANKIGAALVQISTDYVFGGTGTRPYREYDPVAPQSVYGKSKLDGEILVRNHCQRHYIIRTAWLFGQNGNNFVRTMLRLAQAKEELAVVDDQVGSPTFTWDLAEKIALLAETGAYGTYHLTNSGVCSWFEFCREILRQAGYSEVKVRPISTEQLNRPAKRPRYSVLDNYIWRMDGHEPLRTYQEALADYLKREKRLEDQQ